jgi:hypothetical protein
MFIPGIVDINAIMQLHNGSAFSFPDLTNPLYISKRMCLDKNGIVAAGFIKIMAEGILLTNKERPAITRAKGSVEILNRLKRDAKYAGLDSCHVFVSDEKVHKFLKHYGFDDCPEKYTMYIEF